ncbi:hypothetical protein [Parvibium lacunae]|uniref:Uncharacterized protein n=1 Tax=Parvibium lacunae TaxID=1888893 RepID=A0A368L939_9BURK|nr:hypothetical protein [Parvibium lacunae]RCS59749.1 hypothetical protein DU000_03305 [Parvibium lacunae]
MSEELEKIMKSFPIKARLFSQAALSEVDRLRKLNAELVDALTTSSKWALPIMERDARSPSNSQWATEEINQEKNFIVSVLAKAKEQS